MVMRKDIFVDLEKFIDRINYIDGEFESEDFSGNYVPDFKFNYEEDDNSLPENEWLYLIKKIEYVAAKCIQKRKYATRLFDEKYNKITPAELYELGYFSYMKILNKSINHPLGEISVSIIKGVSLNRFMEIENVRKQEEINSSDYSEWNVAEVLFDVEPRIACDIITHLKIRNDHKKELKKWIIRRNPDSFIEYLIENGIDASEFENACCLLDNKKLVTNMQSAESIDFYKRNVLEDDSLNMGEEDRNTLHNIIYHPYSIPMNIMVNVMYTNIIRNLYSIFPLSQICNNNSAIAELEDFIESHPDILKDLEDFANSGNLEFASTTIPVLEEFKSKFVSDTQLPPSIGRNKEKEDCFDWNNQEKSGWTFNVIYYLYSLLVEQGFLEWSEEIAFSFLYRMCPSYQPENSDVKPIVWLGDTSTLWTMVFHFYGGTSKMDKLTRTFFIKPDGTQFKGGKNSSACKDKKLEPDTLRPPF